MFCFVFLLEDELTDILKYILATLVDHEESVALETTEAGEQCKMLSTLMLKVK